MHDLEILREKNRNEELAMILKGITKDGETRRLSSLDSAQVMYLFQLLAYHQVYFSKKYGKGEIGLIPQLVEMYLDLAVSETREKEKNLLEIISELFIGAKKIENENMEIPRR